MATAITSQQMNLLSLMLSFLFVVMASTSTSCPSVYAFAFHNSFQRLSNIHPSTYRSRSSSRSDTSVAYTSTPFDVDNTNDLWQLLQELQYNTRNDKQNSPSDNEAFQRVIQALYRESKLNIHNLEKEIEMLRQKLDAPISADDGSCFHESFQSKTVDNTSGRQNNESNNMDVDEISNKLLKAVFVGYSWTEEDRKRLSSAHPQD